MSTGSSTGITFSRAIVGLIPIAALLLMLGDLLALAQQQAALLATVICALLYVLSIHYAGPIHKRLWTGYVGLASLVAWLSAGLAAGLLVVVVGSIAGAYSLAQQKSSLETTQTWVMEGLARIAIGGIPVLIAWLIFTALGGTAPLRFNQSAQAQGALLLLSAGLVQVLTAHLVGCALLSLNLREHFQRVRQYAAMEGLLLLVGLLLPTILYEIGVGPFIILIGLLVVQALRHNQIARIREELEQRVQEMSSLQKMSQSIATNLVLDEVLQNIYNETQQMLKARTFFVALYDESQQRIEYPLVIRDGVRIQWSRRKLQQGLTDTVIRTRQPLYITAAQTQRLRQLGIQLHEVESAAYVGVPLLVGPKLVGVLGALHDSDPQAFQPNSLELMQVIASQASLAIRNASLYQRTVTVADHLAQINQSLQTVTFNLDRHEALRSACELAMRISGAPKAAVFLLDISGRSVMRMAESAGFNADEKFDHLELELDAGLYEHGPRLTQNIAESKDPLLRHQAALGGFRACAEIPLRSGSSIIGLLTVYHDETHDYEAPETNLLEMIANQITAALDNADLLHALEMYAFEQAQLVHLARISGANLNLDRVVIDVCGAVAQMLNVSSAEIGIFHMEPARVEILTPVSNDEVGTTILDAGQIPEFGDILSERTFSPQTFYIPHGGFSAELHEFMHERHQQSVMLVPLTVNYTAIGLLILGATREMKPTDNERRLLEMAAFQIGAQIHNARVHRLTEDALVHRLQQLIYIEEVAQQISQSLDQREVIDSVLDTVIQATNADLAALGMRDGEQLRVEMRERRGEQTMQEQILVPTGHGVMGRVLRTSSMLLCGDNQQISYYEPLSPDSAYRSTLTVPLVNGDETVGVLHLESRVPNFFTSEQASFVNSLAGHASINIHNSQLLEERQYQVRTLTQLRELALMTISSDEPSEVVQIILRHTLQILGGSEAVLFSVDAVSSELTQIAALATDPEHARFAPDSGRILAPALNQAVASNEPLLLDDARQISSSAEASTYASIVMLPIQRRSRLREVLMIGYAQPQHFTPREQHTLEMLTAQIAGHLENAELTSDLQDSNDRMRAILDANRDGILLLDPAGHLQDANRAAEQLLGIELRQKRRELFGELLAASMLNAEQLPLREWTSLPELQNDAHTITDREYPVQRTDQMLYIREVSVPVYDAEQHVIGRLLALRDVSQERDLLQYRESIRRMILHDLRGPLSSIISSMHLALAILDDPSDPAVTGQVRSTLEVSLESALNLLNLVESLQDLPRLGEGKMMMTPAQVSLHAIANKAQGAIGASLREAALNLQMNLNAAVDDLYVDPDLIRRVLINLLHNAFKFTPPGGTILIHSEPDPDDPAFARIQVCDTGPGIPPEMRLRIFNEFEQIEGRKPRQGGKGSGLGLTFCKLAVEAHGGRIWVSAEGPLPGACFTFTLPTLQAMDARPSAQEESAGS